VTEKSINYKIGAEENMISYKKEMNNMNEKWKNFFIEYTTIFTNFDNNEE